MANSQHLLERVLKELRNKQSNCAAAVNSPLSFKKSRKLKHSEKLPKSMFPLFYLHPLAGLTALTPSHLSTKVFFRFTIFSRQKRKLKQKNLKLYSVSMSIPCSCWEFTAAFSNFQRTTSSIKLPQLSLAFTVWSYSFHALSWCVCWCLWQTASCNSKLLIAAICLAGAASSWHPLKKVLQAYKYISILVLEWIWLCL